MSEVAYSLRERLVAGFILGAMRDVIPDQVATMNRLLVDADDPITGLFQERDDRAPAFGVVPILALGGALDRDADVGFDDRSRIIFNGQSRLGFGWIDAENMAGGAMQPDIAKV